MAEVNGIIDIAGNQVASTSAPLINLAGRKTAEQISEEKKSSDIDTKEGLNVQCFLVDNLLQIAQSKAKQAINSGLPEYDSFVMLEAHGGGPGDVTQEILSRKGLKELFNLSSAQKALLVPKIEIYKITYNNTEGVNGTDVKLVFADSMRNSEIESLISGKKGRGDDVGLKSFSYAFDATQPAESGIIKTTLTLLFQNASGFTESRPNGITFSDLIWDKNSVSKTGIVFNPLAFRMKIVSGWAVPSDPGGVLFSKDLLKAIENTKTILFVTHVKHDLEFNEDGTLRVTIEFCGAIDIALGDTIKSNLFQTNSYLQKRLDKERLKEKEKQEAITKQSQASGQAAVDSAIAGSKVDEKGSIAILEAIDKQEKYSRIIKELYDSSSMYYIDIDASMLQVLDDEKKNYTAEKIKEKRGTDKVDDKEIENVAIQERMNGRRVSSKLEINRVDSDEGKKRLEKKKEILKAGMKEALDVSRQYGLKFTTSLSTEKDFWDETVTTKKNTEEEKNKIIATAIKSASTSELLTSGKVRAYFFYLGDLLDSIFRKFVYKRADLDNMRIMLGTLVYTDPRTKKQEEVNIADIPISLERFITWYTKKVISTQPVTYLVRQFIRDVLEQIVIGALGEYCFGNLSQNLPNIVFNIFSVPATSGEPLAHLKNGKRYSFKGGLSKPGDDSIKKSDASDSTKVQHFLYIYANNYNITNANGDLNEDASRGVYHLAPGLDRGLVKNVKFVKNAVQFMAEAQLTSENKKTRLSPNVYNATVRMLGNNLFMNGNYIYIDTARMNLGSPFKKEFGKLQPNMLSFEYHLGGYYMVTKVSFDFTESDYETVLTARWVGALPEENDLFNMANNGLGTVKFASQQSVMKDKSLFYGDELPNLKDFKGQSKAK